MSSSDLWRRRLGLWLPALLFFLATLVALVVYPVRYAGRTEVTQEELNEARQVLARLEARLERVEDQAAWVEQTRSGLQELYGERLAPERARLTRVIAEVKDLASRAGLEPQQISYPSEPLEEFGLRKRSFVFRVDGSYSDLRKFVNLLELSESFLTLEQVTLSGAGARGGLSIQLRISTLFALDEGLPLEADGAREGRS